MFQGVLLLAVVAAQTALCDRPSEDGRLRQAMAQPKQCVLSYAAKLAPSPDRADLAADAALGFCEQDFVSLRSEAVACRSDRFASGLDKELRRRFREMALAEIVAYRASR